MKRIKGFGFKILKRDKGGIKRFQNKNLNCGMWVKTNMAK